MVAAAQIVTAVTSPANTTTSTGFHGRLATRRFPSDMTSNNRFGAGDADAERLTADSGSRPRAVTCPNLAQKVGQQPEAEDQHTDEDGRDADEEGPIEMHHQHDGEGTH